jgi:hypothetical protein
MTRRRQAEIPMGMEKVWRRFEDWRSSHQRRRRPIPERLWIAATETARKHGVFRTAKVLRLDYAKLKQMIDTVGASERSASKAPAFFELVPTESAGLSECVIEMESPRGKIRVQWKGMTPPDLAGLSRTLWEAK